MRLKSGLLAASILAACSGDVAGVDCKSTSDCLAGSECRDGICVQVACVPACGAFEECRAALCAPAFLAPVIESPGNGAQVIGGVDVVARLDRAAADGTAEPPARLKLVAAGTTGNSVEAFLERASGTLRYQGAIAVPSGAYSLKAVFTEAGLESAPLTITVAECGQPCGSFQECIQAECRPVFDSIALVAPPATRSPFAVTARLHRAVTTSQKEPPATMAIELTPSSGTSIPILTRIDGTEDYEATVTVPDGSYDLVATSVELAVSSEPATVLVDTTPPVFELAVLPPPQRPQHPGLSTSDPESPNAYRRDEEAVVRISCSESRSGVSAESLRLKVLGDPGGETTVSPAASASCGDNLCCFEAVVPLFESALQMNAFRTAFRMELSGSDLLGNASTASGEIPVTRFKWSLNAGNGPITTTPAIGRTGFVYFGGSNSPGHAFSASPEGKLTDLMTTSGPVAQSMVVSIEGPQDKLFVAGTSGDGSSVPCGTGTTGAVWVVNDADAIGPIPECVCNGGTSAAAHLALTKTIMESGEQPADTAVTVFGKATGALAIAARPAASSNKCVLGAVGTAPSEHAGIALRNAMLVFSDATGRIRAFGLTPDSLLSAWSSDVSAFGASPLWLPNGEIVFSANTGPSGHLVRLTEQGSILASTAQSPSLASPVAKSSVSNTSILCGTAAGTIARADASFTADAVLGEFSSSGGGNNGSLALGSDKAAYSLASESVFSFQEDGEVLWQSAFLGLGSSSPALDCARSPDGSPISKPGVLYAGSTSGLLYAFVTDSHGLDYDSPWPKFNRDPQNTGDADRTFPVGHPLRCP
jgi:hypothetical protein